MLNLNLLFKKKTFKVSLRVTKIVEEWRKNSETISVKEMS